MNSLIQECKDASEKRAASVAQVLDEMIANGEYISFGAVARRAGVSRSYLYRHAAIAERIKNVRIPNLTKEQLRAELVRERAKHS